MKFKTIATIFLISTIFLFSLKISHATLDDPAPGGVGRNKADTTLKNILDMLLGGSIDTSSDPNNPDPDPTGAYATPTTGPAITYPPPNTDEAAYANEVVNYARNNCNSYKDSVTGDCQGNPLCGSNNLGKIYKKGIIDEDNYSCVDNFAPIMNSGARSEITRSAADYVFAQCVAGVRSQSEARGRPYDGYGNAIDHARSNNDPNYTYFTRSTDPNYTRLVPGSIIIQDLGTFGHIMYVTEVNKDPQTQVADNVIVYEFNYGYYLYGSVRHGRALSVGNIKGWQTPKSLL